ncbi:hypothetical protein [Agathobacter rectalis]|jgi:hypothetical protein|uniref:Uncharacterized protein n=1 Tax=Agathobacter rectalis TaxID=39491 RepID=A0A3E4YLT9_9FIRM|nr:hypothetical protein [Agathobacter rectalis]MCB7108862.1 hypothetical protein [Agathobacter rectalis]MCG4812154.1 hypothetical protein [Agathobacter rectalis]RGM75512.1 hypothetical protein DXB99_03020 [Agathobacter rectalis]
MSYIRCPYCNQSDGNDDKIVNKRIEVLYDTECQIVVTKKCDICQKEYDVLKVFDLRYEELNYTNFENI